MGMSKSKGLSLINGLRLGKSFGANCRFLNRQENEANKGVKDSSYLTPTKIHPL